MRRHYISILVLGFIVMMNSCNVREKREAENKKYDSLFLGISFGMGKKAFFDHCWDYNKKRILTHGPTNQNVEYRLATELNSPVSMRFYPTFYEDKIYEMPVTFTYESWAPWAPQFKADTLFVNLLPLFEKWYGKGFKELDHPTMGKVYYKMDGRRRINLFLKDDQYVMAVFTDLKVEKHLKDLAEETSTPVEN